MMKKKISLILLILILIVPAVRVNASRELTGDNLDFGQDEQGQVFTARGNVELIYDDLRITAEDEGVYRRYNGEVEFRNNVQFFYQQFEAKAVELTGNLQQQIFHLIDQAQIRGENSYLEADRIDIYQAEKRIEVKGNAYLEYNDFWAEADEITYHFDQELINLEGNVRGERNGESFSSQSAEINQKTEEVRLKGRAKLTLPDAEESSSEETMEE